jgi:hypothetical protein
MTQRPSRSLDATAKPPKPGAIRIDEKAARAAYAAMNYQRLLAVALVKYPGEADITGDCREILQKQAIIEEAEKALITSAARFEAVTSTSEAAALTALIAVILQKRDPNRKSRGRPPRNTASEFDIKLRDVILNVHKIHPECSRFELFKAFAEMIKNGSAQFDRSFPEPLSTASLDTIIKRVQRSFDAAMKHGAPGKT